MRAWARSGIAGMLWAERGGEEEGKGESGRNRASPPLEAETEETRKFIESYGLLVRVKDDTGGENEDVPEAFDPLETLPGLLRGAAVGTKNFVATMAEKWRFKHNREPTVATTSETGFAICQARRHRKTADLQA